MSGYKYTGPEIVAEGLNTNKATWSMMSEEAVKALHVVDLILQGREVAPELQEEFFHDYPRILKLSCTGPQLKGAENACCEAINVLYRLYKGEIEELNFVDRSLVDRLQNVLDTIAAGPRLLESMLQPSPGLGAFDTLRSTMFDNAFKSTPHAAPSAFWNWVTP